MQDVGQWPTPIYVSPVLEYILQGDIDTYGPRGTGEETFTSPIFVTAGKVRGGGIAEDWTVTADEIVFNIRPGIYWTGREGVMEAREYTAYDMEWNLNRYFASGSAAWWHPEDWILSVTATDKYTLVIDTIITHANWWFYVAAGWGNPQYAEENFDVGMTWDNLVGTGPFMVKEYIPGSAFIYEPNPNYWDTSPVNGVEYEIPFVDELVIAIIPDESTRIASLRTGKIDLVGGYIPPVALRYEDTLRATCPDLVLAKASNDWAHLVTFELETEIVSDRDVRRALMIGTDLETLAQALWGGANLHSWPVSFKNPQVFTPFDDLPASTQLLYEYNPELAAQMIIDAGYPDGFTLILPVDAGQQEDLDKAAMLADMWLDIGVTVDIRAMEAGALEAFQIVEEGMVPHWDVTVGWGEYNVDHLSALRSRVVNRPGIDPWYPETYEEAASIYAGQPELSFSMFKEINWKAIDDVIQIPIGDPFHFNAYWPWVKNWFGETEVSAWGWANPMARVWIDEDLKAALGY